MYYYFNIILYSVMGFIFETIYTFTINKPYDSGFTFGPYALIYGITLAIVFNVYDIVFSKHIKKVYKYILSFLTAIIFISVLEYCCGYLLEKITNNVYWSYSDVPLTYNNYINLFVSLFWAVASILIYKYLKPYTDKLYVYIKEWMIILQTSIILVDVIFSILILL